MPFRAEPLYLDLAGRLSVVAVVSELTLCRSQLKFQTNKPFRKWLHMLGFEKLADKGTI